MHDIYNYNVSRFMRLFSFTAISLLVQAVRKCYLVAENICDDEKINKQQNSNFLFQRNINSSTSGNNCVYLNNDNTVD